MYVEIPRQYPCVAIISKIDAGSVMISLIINESEMNKDGHDAMGCEKNMMIDNYYVLIHAALS